MQVPSAITITPPEPSMLPACCSEAASSVSFSTSAAVRTGVELPPGITALSGLPPSTPPASSKMIAFSG